MLQHALCWIHAERGIHQLKAPTEFHQKILDQVRSQIWEFYQKLKLYQKKPTPLKQQKLTQEFQDLCSQKTEYQTLNLALKRMLKNQKELFRV